jgi:hypothetical protein
MFENLIGLAWGIGAFALIIGITTIVLQNFGNAVGGTANTTVVYLQGQLGQSGLAGWAPAIIALSVGLLFLGAFFVKGGPGKKY